MAISDWWGPGNNWLIEKANAHFSEWVASPSSTKWKKNRSKSPYACGYSQPDWMEEARQALGKGDEQTFKRLKLDNL